MVASVGPSWVMWPKEDIPYGAGEELRSPMRQTLFSSCFRESELERFGSNCFEGVGFDLMLES